MVFVNNFVVKYIHKTIVEVGKVKVKKNANKAGRTIGRALSATVEFTGDAIGLAALRMDRKELAYKAITGSRTVGEEGRKFIETTFNATGELLEEAVSEINVEDLKEKVGKAKESVSHITIDIKDAIMEKAGALSRTETRIYGDSSHFYGESDKIEPEGEEESGGIRFELGRDDD